MWINAPTPVMSRTKHIDSGSISSPASTLKPPTGIQSNIFSVISRFSSPLTEKKRNTAYTKRTTGTAAPSRWPHLSARRPSSSSTAEESSGSAISSQAADWMPCAVVTRPYPSVLQQVRVVHGRAPASSEDGHDDGEADDDLGGSDGHHEERHDLAVEAAVDAREGDQRQVHGVQHQLDAHEDDDGVAPHEHTDGTDREQRGGEHQVVGRAHVSSPS